MSANWFVVVPTRGDSHERVLALCEATKEAGATFVVIHPNPRARIGAPSPSTAEGVVPEILYDGINIVRDAENFQRWGNLGFQAALDQAGENALALMVNDDVIVSAESLKSLFLELEEADVITMNTRYPGASTPMTGWLFGVRPAVIMLDENYVFWWGEDDLWHRAKERDLRIVVSSAPHEHNREDKPAWPPAYDRAVGRDRLRYRTNWE